MKKRNYRKKWMSWILILIMCTTFSLPAAVQAEDAAGETVVTENEDTPVEAEETQEPEVQEPETQGSEEVTTEEQEAELTTQGADNLVKIGIAFTNDVHARVEETTDKEGKLTGIGMPRLKTVVNKITTDKDISLVLDGGDLFHGQSIATLVNGESVAELAAAVGYDAMVTGNHDWNYGKDQLKTLESMSKLSVLAGNVVNQEDGSKFFTNEYLTKTVEKDGNIIKVGVFGVIDPAIYSMTNPSNVAGLKFTDMEVYSNSAVKELKSQGCDIVIGLTHCIDPKALASKIDGVNLWLSGHEHVVMDEAVTTPNGGSAKVVQTGMYLQNVGDIEITCPEDYNTLSPDQQKEALHITAKMVGCQDAADYEEDSAVKDVLDKIKAAQEPILAREVGQSPVALDWSWESVRTNELAIGNVLTDAYIKETRANVAIENAGAIRASMPQGSITYGNVISVLPYGNYLVTKELTGAELKEVMETSIDIMLRNRVADESGDYNAWSAESGSALQIGGMKVVYNANQDKGSRISSLKIGSEDAIDTKLYTVAMNNFTATDSNYSEISGKPIINEYAACDEAVIHYFNSKNEKSTETNITKSTLINRIENTAIVTSGKTPEAIVSQMTLDQKIGQMIMPAFRTYDSTATENKTNVTVMNAAVQAAVEKYGFGGVILFGENTQGTEQTTRLTTAFQEAAVSSNSITQIPLMIATDQEGGSVTRLKTGTSLGGNMALGATRSTELTTQTANIIGSELAAEGINVDFAPDMDVNNNPSNPVIGVRSFSSDANLAATLGTAYITGLHNQNVASAVKHFPGHGDTGTDSHTGLPLINKSYDEIKQCELVPFQSGINAGTDIVMTAHIQYPQIETGTYQSIKTGETINLPATLSKTIITDILRGDMGYDGVVSTDALEMEAIATNFDATDAAVLAINADVDILLMPVDMSTDAGIALMQDYISNIIKQVEQGTIEEATITKSANRIMKLKQERGILEQSSNDVDTKVAAAKSIVGSKDHHDQEWSIMQKGITLVKNENSTLPITVKNGEKIAFFCSYSNEVNSMQYAVNRLKAADLIPQDAICEINCYQDKSVADFEKVIKESDYVFASVETYRIANMNPTDKAGWQSKFLDDLIDATHQAGHKIAVTSIALPYDVARYQNADALLIAYGSKAMDVLPTEYNGETQTYGPNLPVAVCMAFGETVPTGTLPVNIMKLDSSYQYTNEELYPFGYGLINWGKSVDPQKNDSQKISSKKTGVATGDETSVAALCMIMLLAAGAAGILTVKRSRTTGKR